jgi:peptidyl-prolyl cis-trans isomerase B (cyclophilin B)
VAFEEPQRPARQGPALVGAIVGAAVLVGAFVVFVVGRHGGETPGSRSTSAHETPGIASCVWTPNTDPNLAKALTRTGTPQTRGLPAAGTRDLTFVTSQGDITITLDLLHAPCGSASITYLAGANFFDNTSCHRLTTAGIYVLQCGDPSGTGAGGPSYTWEGENYPTTGPRYQQGVVAMAIPSNDDGSPATNLNGSQFFIVWKDTPIDPDTGQSALRPYYTVIGTVTAGMDVVQKVAAGGVYPTDPTILSEGTPKLSVIIKSVTVGPVVGASPN